MNIYEILLVIIQLKQRHTIASRDEFLRWTKAYFQFCFTHNCELNIIYHFGIYAIDRNVLKEFLWNSNFIHELCLLLWFFDYKHFSIQLECLFLLVFTSFWFKYHWISCQTGIHATIMMSALERWHSNVEWTSINWPEIM